MLKIAHIINPVVVNDSSDLFIAQPVTFETMKIAREFAHPGVEVTLFYVQYPEDHSITPEGFIITEDLNRSILDFGTFKKRRKLPIVRDILDRLYESTDADYLIYTNVDIALMPHFYLAVKKLIESGYDALVINRRTISDKYKSLNDIALMYADVGKPHAGYDCFIFRRDAYPKYKLGNVCIGASRMGLVLICNLIAYSKKFKVFKEEHLTFHIGQERVWQNDGYMDYTHYNERETIKILKEFDKESDIFSYNGPLGEFIQDYQKNRDFTFAKELFAHHKNSSESRNIYAGKILRRLLYRR